MEQKASITALMSAFGRAYHAENAKDPIFFDSMQRYIRYYIQGDSTLRERREIVYESLRRINKQIDALKAAQSFMEFKCWVYDAAIDIGSLDDVVNIPRDQMPPVVQETLQRIGRFHPTYVSGLEAREANAAAGK